MSVSHIGGAGPLALVPPRQSPPKPQDATTDFEPPATVNAGQSLPDQAKGAAKGLSLAKHLAKWDRDGDGTLDHGPRFSQGVMGALLKLQEDGAAPSAQGGSGDTPPPTGSGDTPPAAGSGDPAPGADGATTPPTGDGSTAVTADGSTPPGGTTDTPPPVDTGATPPTETASSDGATPPSGGTSPGDTSPGATDTVTADTIAAQLLAGITPPQGQDIAPDPSQLLDTPPA